VAGRNHADALEQAPASPLHRDAEDELRGLAAPGRWAGDDADEEDSVELH
jgi:hypothetical protein